MNKLYTIAVLTALLIYIPLLNALCCHDNKGRTVSFTQTSSVENQHEQTLVEQQLAEQQRIEVEEQEAINDIRFRIVVNGKYGFCDKDGRVVVEPQYDYATDFSEGLARVFIGKTSDCSEQFSGKWGFIDIDGNVVIKIQYDFVENFSKGLAFVGMGDRVGFIDKTGKFMKERLVFSDGLAKKSGKDYKFGFVDNEERFVINPQYDDAGDFSEGLARVGIGDWNMAKWGYIDNRGHYVIQPQYDEAGDFSEGLAKVAIINGYTSSGDDVYNYGFIDKNGNFVISPKYNYAEDFSNGLAKVFIGEVDYMGWKTGKWGVINKEGTVVANIKYDDLGDFSDGLAYAKIGGRYGFIDEKGEMVIPPQFEEPYNSVGFFDFSEGLARVFVKGKYGFIDKKGSFVAEPKFEYATDFCNGVAYVKVNGKLGCIDKTGNYIVAPRFAPVWDPDTCEGD